MAKKKEGEKGRHDEYDADPKAGGDEESDFSDPEGYVDNVSDEGE
jgi:hypothetical protein